MNNKAKPLYNPLKSNFSVTYDINGDQDPITYMIPSRDIAYFESPVYEHMLKHLSREVARENGSKPNFEEAVKQATKKITEMDLDL